MNSGMHTPGVEKQGTPPVLQRSSPDLDRALQAQGVKRFLWWCVVYAGNWLLVLNLALNTLLGGHPQETVSSRVAKHALNGRRWALVLGRILTAIFRDQDHLAQEFSLREGRNAQLARGDRDRSLWA